MPIPKKMLSRNMAGQRVTVMKTLHGRSARIDVPAGTELQVTSAAHGFSLVSPGPCPACGVAIHMAHVPRRDTCLPDSPDAPALEHAAFWLDRSAHNDYLWAECSSCRFQVENYKAVKMGVSSTDYVRPLYRFCPRCGRRMAVRDAAGKVVL